MTALALHASRLRGAVLAAFLGALLACAQTTPSVPDDASSPADASGATAPTAATIAAHEAFSSLPLADPADREAATRGLIAREDPLIIENDQGEIVWDNRDYAFLEEDAPSSANPSLWRQAQLNHLHGLYEVAPGIHQVRGYDLSNLTVIEGETGRILVDPLTSRETAAAAYALVEKHLGKRPIRAILFTHSHIDHFGGIEGILTAEEIEEQGVNVIAPADFVAEATSENVIAGVAMQRRAEFMFGARLPRGPRGHIDSGLGRAPAYGRVGIATPTEHVDRTPTEIVLDGVRFVFQHTPESEAPAEFMFYLPDHQALCGAEVVTRTMHNLYTLRGAKVRDALRWSGYIDEALQLFGGDVEVMFATHHWPTWGNEAIVDYLTKQRDTYKYIHDQTMRLANSGATPQEIAEQIELPPSLQPSFANRGYYGTVRHNAKAVYQWYFGWYDGNPAHLDPLPPQQAGEKYVAAMGGADEVLRKAQAAVDADDLRFAAMLLDHLVFAEPGNERARELLARTYDQLGYRAESGPWRDVYLVGAYELRHGGPEGGASRLELAIDLLRQTPLERFLEAFATRLDGPAAVGVDLAVNLDFTDVRESYTLWIENAVLHHRRQPVDPDAAATVRLTRELLLELIAGRKTAREFLFSDDLRVEGSRTALLRFFSLLEAPDATFAIVEP